MNKLIFSFAVVLFLLVSQVARACWAAPPGMSTGSSASKVHSYSLETASGKFNVFLGSKESSRELWSGQLSGYDGIFSSVHLVNNGKTLLHVRGDHIVRNSKDIAIELVHASGERKFFRASEFVTQIQSYIGSMDWDSGKKISAVTSIAPTSTWHYKDRKITDELYRFTTAENDTFELKFSSNELKKIS